MTAFPPCPGAASACAASVTGVEGHLTYAGATADDGPLGLRITGLPGTVVRETRDRVYAAVASSGQAWPARKMTVTLQPVSLPRHGTGFDLAIAIAVLTAAGTVPAAALDGCVFTAELGLDGSLRPVRGVLPALLAARRAGYTRAVVATGNAAEAVMVAGLAVVPCPDLRTVLAWLRGESFPHQPDISAAGNPAAPGVPPGASLASLAIPPCVRQAIEATAAGGHHLCLTGPHGSRIPALAAGAAALMPPLGPEQTMEVTATHSAAGLLGPGHALLTRPPFRTPYHTATRAVILGGGTGTIRPGEAALAHRGMLFLRDAPEFPRDILTSLRQPLQHGEITVARAGMTAGSRRSSPSSPARPRVPAVAVPAVPAARCRPAATAPGWPANSAATSRSSSTSRRPVPARPAPSPLTMTRTPSPRRASPTPATAPAAGSGTPPGRPTATSPPRSCAAPGRPPPKPSAPSAAPSTSGRSAPAPRTRSSGSPGPWPTWPVPPGPARTSAARHSRSSWE
jgi:magnesium chelatase family protein